MIFLKIQKILNNFIIEVDGNQVKEYCESIDAEYNFISATENKTIIIVMKGIIM